MNQKAGLESVARIARQVGRTEGKPALPASIEQNSWAASSPPVTPLYGTVRSKADRETKIVSSRSAGHAECTSVVGVLDGVLVGDSVGVEVCGGVGVSVARGVGEYVGVGVKVGVAV